MTWRLLVEASLFGVSVAALIAAWAWWPGEPLMWLVFAVCVFVLGGGVSVGLSRLDRRRAARAREEVEK